MYEIKKIDVLSTAKVVSGIFLIASFVPFLFFMVIFLGKIFFSSGYNYHREIWGILIFFISYPIVSLIVGFIIGGVIAWFYNLITPYIGGGLKVDLALVKKEDK